ncbi:DEAD/DEAH box helicase [Cupriavidus sp. IK-TO18]|uniref:DEAD/DEAH box helicase n=1 Tax=Cupriavidus sp. IK-TO18 TaxID=2782182 RepID=UPI00189B71FC|nr:DEAD/DEAH box helicase [Cupriavidus sp. IK-TO18]MBF6989408.1 Helicase associated domain protein [Cupriavidus sp. IK-TO18]
MRLAPRSHQHEAIVDVLHGFQAHDRGQLIMACGTGKTLTALWIAEALKARLTVVFLPSISLVEQFALSWRENVADSSGFDALCVCSDENISRSDQADDISVDSLQRCGLAVTTESKEVSRFICLSGPRVVFSTYHSARVIAAAQALAGAPDFDLMVCDEAHRCAGDARSPFAVVLDGNRIRARKRLFVTATPRVRGNATHDGARASGIVDMDNETVFGPRFHTLPFRRAIDLGLLCDYQVVVVLSNSEDLRTVVEQDGRQRPAAESDKLLEAGLVGVVKALGEFGLRKVITFHHSLSKAARFQRDIGAVADAMRSIGKSQVRVHASFVSGKMKAHQRRAILSQLASAPHSEHRLITNARCLTEGIDVPSVDGIVFVDPRTSEIDIAQALGRALRVSSGKSVGTVVLPILVGEGESPEDVAKSTDFRSIWRVLAALRAHDEEFAAGLNIAKASSLTGKAGSAFDPLAKVAIVGGKHTREIADILRPLLVHDLSDSWEAVFELARQRFERCGDCNAAGHELWPQNSTSGFPLGRWIAGQRDYRNKGRMSMERAKRLETIGIDWKPTDSKWHSTCDAVIRWIDANDNGVVPVGTTSDDELLTIDLGLWATVQRRHHRNGNLSADKVAKLTNAGFSWDPLNDAFEKGFRAAASWAEEHGHCNAPQRTVLPNGYPLGAWISSLRLAQAKGTLPVERQLRLDGIGMQWNYRDSQWEEGFAAAKAWASVHGDCNAPKHSTWPRDGSKGYKLGNWIGTQRKLYGRGELDAAKVKRLEGIGMRWDVRKERHDAAWLKALDRLHAYQRAHRGLLPPMAFSSDDGFALGMWLHVQRDRWRKGTLEKNRVEPLAAAGASPEVNLRGPRTKTKRTGEKLPRSSPPVIAPVAEIVSSAIVVGAASSAPVIWAPAPDNGYVCASETSFSDARPDLWIGRRSRRHLLRKAVAIGE